MAERPVISDEAEAWLEPRRDLGRLLASAQAEADARGELDWLVAVDSSLMRVHQHGATDRRFGGNAATAVGPVPPTAGDTGGTVERHELSS